MNLFFTSPSLYFFRFIFLYIYSIVPFSRKVFFSSCPKTVMVSLLVCIPFVNLFVHIPHARSSHACADVGIIRFCDMFAEKIECEIFVDKWFIILRSVFQNRVNYIDNSLTPYQLSNVNITFYPTNYLIRTFIIK